VEYDKPRVLGDVEPESTSNNAAYTAQNANSDQVASMVGSATTSDTPALDAAEMAVGEAAVSALTGVDAEELVDDVSFDHDEDEDSSEDSDESKEGELTKAETDALRERFESEAQCEVGDDISPDELETAVPMAEGSLGYFEIGAGEQLNISSTGYATCAALMLERKQTEEEGGGKAVAYAHVNGTDLDALGIEELIQEIGLDGLVAYLGAAEVESESAPLQALFALLDQLAIPVAGVLQIPTDDTDASGNLMASFASDGPPSFAATSDVEVEGFMSDREKTMEAANPAFETRRSNARREAEITDLRNSGAEGAEDEAYRQAVALMAEADPKYPMACHPRREDAFRGNQYVDGRRAPNRKNVPSGLALDPGACALEADRPPTGGQDPDAEGGASLVV
jgi:hypothetical protein